MSTTAARPARLARRRRRRRRRDPQPVPARRRRLRRRSCWRRRVLVALLLLLPLAFLILEAAQDGFSTLRPLLFRALTATLLWNTVSLTVVVTALCAVIGTLAAWFVERTDLPGRRIWAVLVVVPIGIPDFVTSFGWKSIFPSIGGFARRHAGDDAGGIPARLPAGGGQPAQRRSRRRRRSRAASASGGCGHSGG